MATIQENKVTPEWVDDLYQIEMTDPVMGGADGVANRQAKQLGARTQWLKKKYENQEDEFNKYKKSVESATELKAGVTKLTSDIVRHKDDGGYAVTPQAVVDYLASQSASVKDVNELRNYESNSLYVNVSGYYASTPGIGGGLFVADKSDKTSTDNGGTIIVSKNGMRWKRVSSMRNLDIADFGGQSGADKFKSFLAEHYINLPSFKTRQDFLISQHNLVWVPDGHVIIAQGLLYRRHAESRYIPDLPGWLPINESFGHFDDNYTESNLPTVVRCRYRAEGEKRWNITEVINPRPGCVKKILLGAPDEQKKIKLEKLHEYVGSSRSRILLSCDGWMTPPIDGKATLQGLQIVDGKVHRDWDTSDYDTNAAAVWLRNGKLKAAKSKDGKSAAKWVEEGAEWTASFARGPVLVEDGRVVPNADTYLSARAAIGQRADRSLVFLNLEGVSGSYGATLQESAQIMVDEKCVIAIALDAGGSSQVWYGAAYACPSSDGSFQEGRAIPSAIEIIADIVEPYDTGWVSIPVIDGVKAGSKGQGGAAIAYRQRGGDVELRLDTVYSFKANTETIITTEELPKRFRNQDYRPIRAIACGFGGAVVPWWSGTYISIQPHKDTPYTYGYTEWPMPNSK
ncbi:MAG: phosphodiester glycosidase family protein [Kingella sp. (in: b-proteobacteria)]